METQLEMLCGRFVNTAGNCESRTNTLISLLLLQRLTLSRNKNVLEVFVSAVSFRNLVKTRAETIRDFALAI